jgi:hypothetical protein
VWLCLSGNSPTPLASQICASPVHHLTAYMEIAQLLAPTGSMMFMLTFETRTYVHETTGGERWEKASTKSLASGL